MTNPSAIPVSPSGRHGPLIGFVERMPIIAGGLVAILGAAALAGWALNIPAVITPTTGGYPILPLMALCFVLAGIALIMAVRRRRIASSDAIQQTLAALVATIAGLTLYEYLRGSSSGFDLLLFGDKVKRVSTIPPGRIAINSAGSLLLFALALLSIPHDQRRQDLRAQMFATPALLIALLAILGYLFGVKGMYSLSQSSGMALWTAIGQLILGVGILVAVRDRGVAVLLLDDGPGGVLTRRLLPAALLAPILLGVIRILGEPSGFYESEFGVSLFAVASIMTFVGLVLWSARVLRNTDKERVDLLLLEQQARAHAEKARNEAELARAEAERANNSKTDFLAVMSHELRTPRHLLGLIDEILTFARVDIGRERVRWESMSINHTIADAAALVEPMAAAKSIDFIVDLLEEDESIQTDGTKLRQMLVNLLSNGIKFTENGEVRVSCLVNNGVLELRIADTGVGISAENIEEVFEPFWQAEQSTTRKTGGTGLGLSVTRKLARLLGGDVTVASRLGAGTTFLLTLPMKAPAGEPVRRRDTPTTPTSAVAAFRG